MIDQTLFVSTMGANSFTDFIISYLIEFAMTIFERLYYDRVFAVAQRVLKWVWGKVRVCLALVEPDEEEHHVKCEGSGPPCLTLRSLSGYRVI